VSDLEQKMKEERCDRMILFVRNNLSSAAGAEPLTPEELRAVLVAVQHRLYSMCKYGVREIEDVFSLPTDSFYAQYSVEAALLQCVGDKICRFSLNL
jgi:hypothetical protein